MQRYKKILHHKPFSPTFFHSSPTFLLKHFLLTWFWHKSLSLCNGFGAIFQRSLRCVVTKAGLKRNGASVEKKRGLRYAVTEAPLQNAPFSPAKKPACH